MFWLFTFLLCGWLIGFPWERQKGIAEVKKYVEETYHLTTTDISLSFSIDGMNTAIISTKELPFKFQVYINREDKKVWGDLYLEALVEFNLERFIMEKIVTLENDVKVRVSLENRFSRTFPELTVEDVNSNPNVILEVPQISYFCSIDGVEPGTEESFYVFKQITKYFNPTSIYFKYLNNRNNIENTVYIRNSDFDRIISAEDLLKSEFIQ